MRSNFALKARLSGTEFLDAETGRQKSLPKRVSALPKPTTIAELCAREKCSVRQINITISFAFLAPNLVKAAVEGRLPRGIGIERLRDPPTEWSRQFEALGLNPE